MKIKKIEFDPWFDLLAHRCCKQKDRFHYRIWTAKEINKQVRRNRQEFLGTGFIMDDLVRENDQPKMDAVDEITRYLTQVSHAFLIKEYCSGRNGNGEWCKDWFHGFYYYTTMLFAIGLHGTVDDFIQMANAYEKSSNTVHIVWTEQLPGELGEKAGKWVMENEAAPLFLTETVTAAVACLMGAMKEPEFEEE